MILLPLILTALLLSFPLLVRLYCRLRWPWLRDWWECDRCGRRFDSRDETVEEIEFDADYCGKKTCGKCSDNQQTYD